MGGERELAARLRLLVGLPTAAAADPSEPAARYPALSTTTAVAPAPVDPYVLTLTLSLILTLTLTPTPP